MISPSADAEECPVCAGNGCFHCDYFGLSTNARRLRAEAEIQKLEQQLAEAQKKLTYKEGEYEKLRIAFYRMMDTKRSELFRLSQVNEKLVDALASIDARDARAYKIAGAALAEATKESI